MLRLESRHVPQVFLVFLYQRWLYPVDKTRANEYGIAYEREADARVGSDKRAQNDTQLLEHQQAETHAAKGPFKRKRVVKATKDDESAQGGLRIRRMTRSLSRELATNAAQAPGPGE